MRKEIYLMFFFLGALIINLNAQEVKVQAAWGSAVPIGNMTDNYRKISGRGFQLDVDQRVNEHFTYGGNVSWQAFFEKDFQMYAQDQTLITGWQRNYLNALLLMASGKYYFATSVTKIKAYLGLDIGATAIEDYQIFGIYENRELNWHFAVSPSLGVDIPAGEHFGVNFFIKIPNSFKNNTDIHYTWINTGLGLYVKIPDN